MEAWEIGWGADLIAWLQAHLLPAGEPFCAIFHLLGSGWFYIVFISCLYWCVSPAHGRRLAVRFLGGVWLNALAKWTFRRPRPGSVPGINQLFVDGTPGFPSGHTQQALTVFGSLAVWARKPRTAWIAATVYVVLMALSRMVAGMHYLQDVLGGALLGGLWLAAVSWAEPRAIAWLKRRELGRQIVASLAFVFALALVARGAACWRPELLKDSVRPLGALLGVVLGFELETATLGFTPVAGRWRKVAAGAIGLASVSAVYAGLHWLLGGSPLGVFARYALLGGWLSLGAPWLLVGCRCADRRKADCRAAQTPSSASEES